MTAYALILASSMAGYTGLGWWTVVVTGLCLHLTVIHNYQTLLPRFRALGGLDKLAWGWGASILQGLIATSVAFGFGRLVATVM